MEPDGIHRRVLKELADVIAGLLSIIFQWSWESGEVPGNWKLANVVPVFKKGKKVITDLSVLLQCLVKLWRRLFWELLKNT